jgi:hypothetical protein
MTWTAKYAMMEIIAHPNFDNRLVDFCDFITLPTSFAKTQLRFFQDLFN